MNLLVHILLASLVLMLPVASLTTKEGIPKKPFDIKKYKLDQKLSESFSQDPELNPFLKALETLPNKYTRQEQIEEILGPKFSKIQEQVKAAEQFAIILIKEDMKVYEQTLPFNNGNLLKVFNDFYDLMDMKLNPDTIFLNKESYVFFWEIPESQFTAVYTMLAEYYEEYPKLERHVAATQKAFIRVINEVVYMKCPEYEHREAETFSQGLSVEIEEPEVEPPSRVQPVEYDQERIKIIFETLHTPADPNYVFHNNGVSIQTIRAMFALSTYALIAF